MALKSAYYPESRISYTTFCYRGLHCEQRNTGLFFFLFQGCANKKSKVINECVLFAAVRQPLCSTEENLDLGANFLKVLKSNAAVKMFQPQPETPFVSSSPFFPWLPSTVNLLLSPCSKSCRINDFFPSLCKHWAWFLWKNTDLQLFLKVSTRLVKRTPCWPDEVLQLT